MDAGELQGKIKKAIGTMKGFEAMGGSMVTDAIADLKLISETIGDSDNPDLSSVEEKIRAMNNMIGPYKAMVPEVGVAMDALMSNLE